MSASAQTSAFGFGTPFFEQIEFFRQKLKLPTERWDDIVTSAHDRAFIVAGAAKADLLDDLQQTVFSRMADGRGLEAFRQDFRRIVARHGWTGWTGEGSAAGEAWRTKIIYQTNMATSYAAGRYKQLTDPAFLQLRPYWRYVHNDSVQHPRPMHLAWGNARLTLRYDDPFWQTHFPPNGWGCHCRVTPVEAPLGDDATAPPADWDAINPKTGVPNGIDKGFAYAPGRTWHPDLEKYPRDLAKQVIAESMSDGVFERWLGRIGSDVAAQLRLPEYAGLDKDAAVSLLRERLDVGEAFPVAVMAADKQALLNVSKQTVMFSNYDAIKQAYSRMDDPNFTWDAYRSAQSVLDDVDLIIRETTQMTVWFMRDGRLMVGVLAQTKTGQGIFLKSLRYGSEKDRARAAARGQELFKK